MKKIILILALLVGSSVSAGNPNDKVIYCPNKITCANKICSFDSEDAKYFGKMAIVHNDGSPLLASYPYQSTVAGFHSNNTLAYCNYGNLNLEIKAASNLEAYRIEGSSWIGKNTTEKCSGNCPLHEGMGFVVINSIRPSGIYVSIVQQDISQLITENSRIIFDDTLLKCGGLKECIIDLQSDQRETYGSIIVDMDSMKIVQVNSLDPSIEINKINGLNAVEIKKIDEIDEKKEYEAIYCPPVLKCNKTDGCTFASIDAKYFGKINFSGVKANDELIKFSSALVNDPSLKEFICYYGGSGKAAAALFTNPEFHFEHYSHKTGSKWEGLACKSSSANDCPFYKRFDIVIHNVNIGNGLYASIANTYISKLFSNNSFLSIAHNNTVQGCDGNTECTINLLSSKQVLYGSVTIDTKTMKILRMDSLYPNYIKISKTPSTESDIAEVSYVTALKLMPQNLR